MSSRQLRKLQQQRELQQAKIQEEASEDESEEEPVAPTKSKASLFANLAALEDEEEEEEEEDGAEEKVDVPRPSADLSDDPTPTFTAKRSKKSKKKKKAKNKKPAEKEKHMNGADDIDAALRELDLKPPSGGDSLETTKISTDPEYERVCALLGINTQHLKVANEMRNLFGRTAVDNNDDAGGPVGRGGRRRQRGQQQQVDLETALKGHHAPGKGLSELTLRRNNFIQGKDDWPRGTTGGLTMEMVDDRAEDGTVEFRYVHDQAYQTLQQAFHGYVEMGDPQNLIGLLTRNPYHISLLIQVSKIAKDQTDHALSSDLLERALFSFGRAATSLFNTKLSQGKARLDFARPENRELWLAGYQYIKSLVMKGTYRTALEWAKVLLSLDPEGDPYAMRLMIHHLALRAHEFKWLLDVSESKIPEIWSPGGGQIIHAASHTTPSLAFAALQLRESTQCRALLSPSMQKLPWLFTRLFRELSLDAPPSIWGIVPRSDAETLFTEIYVLQTKDLWNTPEATALLMEIAHTIPKVKEELIPKLENSEMTLDVVRFVYLDNTPALMALAPSKLLHRGNNSDADPLPPDVNVFSYEAQRRAVEGRDWGRDRGNLGGDFFDPLAALARLLPRVRQREGRAEDGPEDSDEDLDEAAWRRLEEIAAEGEDDGEEEDEVERPDGNHSIPVSLARRLLSMFWRNNDLIEEDEDGDGDEDGDDDTETDDEMPELVDQ